MLDIFFFCTLFSVTAAGLFFWLELLLARIHSKSKYCLENHPTPFGLLDVLICFFVCFALPPLLTNDVLTTVCLHTDFDELSEPGTNMLIGLNAVLQLVACIVVAAFYLFRYGKPSAVFGIRYELLPAQIRIAFRFFTMVVPGLLGLHWLFSQLVPYEHSTLQQLQENFSVVTISVTWFAAVVAAPICEELFFRSVLQGWLQRIPFGSAHEDGLSEITGGWPRQAQSRTSATNVADTPDVSKNKCDQEPVSQPSPIETQSLVRWWMPIVVSSALFGAIHLGQGPAPITLFFFGLALGFLYRKTGSIVPPLILHFLLNAFSMYWATLTQFVSAMNDVH